MKSFLFIKALRYLILKIFYGKQYEKPLYINAKIHSYIDILSILPKFFIESITIGLMLIIIIFLLSNNSESFAEIKILLSLYAFATYRLMPSLQKLYSGINSFFNSLAINSI